MEALRPESCSSMLLQQQQQLEQFWVQIINGRGCSQNKSVCGGGAFGYVALLGVFTSICICRFGLRYQDSWLTPATVYAGQFVVPADVIGFEIHQIVVVPLQRVSWHRSRASFLLTSAIFASFPRSERSGE